MCPQPIRAEGGRGSKRSGSEGDLQRRRASHASVSSLQLAETGATLDAEPARSGEGRECAPTSGGCGGLAPCENEGQCEHCGRV